MSVRNEQHSREIYLPIQIVRDQQIFRFQIAMNNLIRNQHHFTYNKTKQNKTNKTKRNEMIVTCLLCKYATADATSRYRDQQQTNTLVSKTKFNFILKLKTKKNQHESAKQNSTMPLFFFKNKNPKSTTYCPTQPQIIRQIDLNTVLFFVNPTRWKQNQTEHAYGVVFQHIVELTARNKLHQ